MMINTKMVCMFAEVDESKDNNRKQTQETTWAEIMKEGMMDWT